MEIRDAAAANTAGVITLGSSNWTTLVDDIAKQEGLTGIADASLGTKIAIATAAGASASSTAYSIYAVLNAGGYFCISSGGTTKTGAGALPAMTNASAGTCL